MKTYKISAVPVLGYMEYADYPNKEIFEVNEISELEFELLSDELKPEDNLVKEDFLYCRLSDCVDLYVCKKDIIETEYFTKEECIKQTIDFADFMSENPEITFNPIVKKWDTTIGIGFQTTEELYRIYEASKSKLSVKSYSEILQSMIESCFHMNDDQAKVVVDEFVKAYPDLLRYRDIDWYYKHV